MHRGAVARIDCSALLHNLRVLKGMVDHRPVIAVVKADAYGHGAVEVAKALQSRGVDMLAVAYAEEARILREAGIDTRILVLFDRSDIPAYFDLGLTPVLHDRKTADAFSKEAQKRNTTVPVHLKIDTGMGRLGFRPDSAVSDAVDIANLKGLVLEGLLSHFSEADLADRSFAEQQIRVFTALHNEISRNTGLTLLRHMANSAAVCSLPEARLDAVRPGIALYGHTPVEGSFGFRPVMNIKTTVLSVRSLPAGTPVSYGRTFVTRRDSRIATVSLGYADGFSRLFSNNAEMLVNGSRAPVAGRVCMDLTMLDVTDVGPVSEGDEVVVLGTQQDQTITADELARRSNTIPYEILTSLGSRAKKEYIPCLQDHDA